MRYKCTKPNTHIPHQVHLLYICVMNQRVSIKSIFSNLLFAAVLLQFALVLAHPLFAHKHEHKVCATKTEQHIHDESYAFESCELCASYFNRSSFILSSVFFWAPTANFSAHLRPTYLFEAPQLQAVHLNQIRGRAPPVYVSTFL
jgi:hypothetical protein